MAKKCIPTGVGVICIENMTLFILALLSISVGYLYYKQYGSGSSSAGLPKTVIINNHLPPGSDSSNLHIPPLNTIDVRGPPVMVGGGQGLPINIRTSTANTSYSQIGILTKTVRSGNGTDPLILPLFGRNLLNGRDKWQYYTVANSGGVAFNAKLPVSVNGRSCTGEYGCDSISNGDTVYVEGYDDTFRATIYENATMNYIPF
jgi:hypothetical protein